MIVIGVASCVGLGFLGRHVLGGGAPPESHSEASASTADIALEKIPSGVNFGGWFCLEDWFHSNNGRYVSTPLAQYPDGQGACLPPLLQQSDIRWQSEGRLVKQLADKHGDKMAVEIFQEHRNHYITDNDFELVKEKGIGGIRLPITWAAFADALVDVDGIYGSFDPDKEAVVVPDPYYNNTHAMVTIPRNKLKEILRKAAGLDLKINFDLHAFPGGSSDGTFNGIWPQTPQMWKENAQFGNPIPLVDLGTNVAKALIDWVADELSEEEQGAVGGISPMNEPAHLAWGTAKWGGYEDVLPWYTEVANYFKERDLGSKGIKFYVQLIDTAYPDWGKDFVTLTKPWYDGLFTEEEQKTWAVMDWHWYTAWSGDKCSGRSVEGGAYLCDASADEIQKILLGDDCMLKFAKTFKEAFPHLKAISEFSIGSFHEADKACKDKGPQNLFLNLQVKTWNDYGIEPFFWTWRVPYGPEFEPGWSLKYIMGLEDEKENFNCSLPTNDRYIEPESADTDTDTKQPATHTDDDPADAEDVATTTALPDDEVPDEDDAEDTHEAQGGGEKRAIPSGVNFGGWFCLEDWFHSNNGRFVSTPLDLYPDGQGACLPPGLPQHKTRWQSEGQLVRQLVDEFGVDRAVEIFQEHRSHYITDSDWDLVESMGISSIRLPITWAAFPDALIEVDDVYGEFNADTETTVVPDPYYKDTHSMVTIPRNALKDILGKAADRGLKVNFDLHAFPGGSSDGTFNGIWPNKPRMWTDMPKVGNWSANSHAHLSLRELGVRVAKKLIDWVAELPDRERSAVLGVSPMNEPGHLSWGKPATSPGGWGGGHEDVLPWYKEVAEYFRQEKLGDQGIRFYVQLIETAFEQTETWIDDFLGIVKPWFNEVFTEEEQMLWAVFDFHWYSGWSGEDASGRTVSGGAYLCDATDSEIREALLKECDGCMVTRGRTYAAAFPGLKAISEFSIGTFHEADKACKNPRAQNLFLDLQVQTWEQEFNVEPFFWTWKVPYGPEFEPGWSLKYILGEEKAELNHPCKLPETDRYNEPGQECVAAEDCGGHGTTTDKDKTNGCVCDCTDGWSGDDCTTEPARPSAEEFEEAMNAPEEDKTGHAPFADHGNEPSTSLTPEEAAEAAGIVDVPETEDEEEQDDNSSSLT